MKHTVFFTMGLTFFSYLGAQHYTTFDWDKQEWCSEIEEEYSTYDYFVQVREAAFLPIQHFKEYSHQTRASTQVEAALAIKDNVFMCTDNVLIWANVSWIPEKKRHKSQENQSKIDLLPYSFGLEYQCNVVDSLDIYLGAGPAYTRLRREESKTSLKSFHWGLITKTGFRYAPWPNVFVDVYADYFYTHFKKLKNFYPQQTRHAQLSGFFMGGGLGIRW